MEKIHINLGSDSYDVHIESGLIDKAGSAIADLTGAEKAAVITEDTIDKLYGMRLVSSLEKAGIKAKMIVVPGTEKSRSLPIVNSIYGALADFGLGNDDILIALGGRIVGDVTGFAAATWHRGVRYIQFPTSVLSQIGSAIGGSRQEPRRHVLPACCRLHRPLHGEIPPAPLPPQRTWRSCETGLRR